jgi:hypothetical protein
VISRPTEPNQKKYASISTMQMATICRTNFFLTVMGGKNQSDMKQGKKGIPNGVPFFILNIIRV